MQHAGRIAILVLLGMVLACGLPALASAADAFVDRDLTVGQTGPGMRASLDHRSVVSSASSATDTTPRRGITRLAALPTPTPPLLGSSQAGVRLLT